jgi:hypothetical protein
MASSTTLDLQELRDLEARTGIVTFLPSACL